jgi:hypothetical protein
MFEKLFSFPNPVNEITARLVAGGVVLLGVIAILWDQQWLLFIIAYGFLARTLTGPTLSPLGQIATRIITPALNLPPKYCPGPPKRFAQAIGATLSVAAVALSSAFNSAQGAYLVLSVLVFFAFLESVFGFCLGCKIFSLLMRLGIIPTEVCAKCNNLNLH